MAAARKSRILDWDVTTPESERNGYGWPQIVRTELENGMAIKGGSAVLSQTHGAFSARWDWTPLLQCPKIVHDRHYPIAPKLVLLQSEDHAAFPKRNHCRRLQGIPSGCHFSCSHHSERCHFHYSRQKRHLPCHCWLDLCRPLIYRLDLVGLDSAERRDTLDPHCSQRRGVMRLLVDQCFQGATMPIALLTWTLGLLPSGSASQR